MSFTYPAAQPPPSWALQIPNAPISPDRGAGLVPPFTFQELWEMGQQWIEGFLKQVVLALEGAFVNGVSAFEQLTAWAAGIAEDIVNAGVNAVAALPALIAQGFDFLTTLVTWFLEKLGVPEGERVLPRQGLVDPVRGVIGRGKRVEFRDQSIQ